MADIDIDALLPSLTVAWRGREWIVKTGLPISAVASIKEETGGEMNAANPEHALLVVAAMFRVPSDEIRALDPTREELWLILAKVAEHFGVSSGGSSASSETSPE
jgi:hypothetical protein